MNGKHRIQVFEYEKLCIDSVYGDDKVKFLRKHFDALVKLNEYHEGKYFAIGHKKIQFKQYVGVIQIDGLTIEVLPKIDKDAHSKQQWQEALIGMLKATRKLKVNKVGHANVNKQSIHLLDIYFEWYLNELQLLLHQGLIRQYYRKRSNLTVLKGKLVFSDHISKNLIHKERFYTEHQTYDYDHTIHQILRKALKIVEDLSKGNYLYSYCKTIQLDFPETKTITVDENTFARLPITRKTQPYQTALEIARLIILNFAPNITRGKENMLALLFDMNVLWEEYVLVMLRKAAKEKDLTIKGQTKQRFWNSITIKPDIEIVKEGKTIYIIDTKWKRITNNKPSMDDLRQMYAYNMYWDCGHSMLLYPCVNENVKKIYKGTYWKGRDKNDKGYIPNNCELAFINIFNEEGQLDRFLGDRLLKKITF